MRSDERRWKRPTLEVKGTPDHYLKKEGVPDPNNIGTWVTYYPDMQYENTVYHCDRQPCGFCHWLQQQGVIGK
jgi:hypothetical protein